MTPSAKFVGTARVAGGAAQWKSDTTGREGKWVLHEDADRRVLAYYVGGVGKVGELQPAQ